MAVRPDVPERFPDETEHRRLLAKRVNASLTHDGSRGATAPVLLAEYAVADLPDASLWEKGVIYVPDETGGATLAFSDGTNWRRVQDRTVVS